MSTRVYRTLLWLYPRSFRLAYGEDMVAVFEEMQRDRSPLALWWRVAVDAITSVTVERLESVMTSSRSRILAFGGFISLFIAVVALAVRGGTPGAFFGFLFVALAAAGVAIGLFLKANAAYVEPTRQMHQHWWRYLLAAALLLAAGVVATEVVGVDGPWLLLFVDVIAGWFLVAMGLVLGAWHGLYRLRSVRPSA